MANPQNSATPLMAVSDRALAELGVMFGLISIAGVGVPMIWPDGKLIGAIFVLFGGGGFDLAPKFYPAVSSLLAFGLPCLAVEATGAGAEPLA